MDPLSIIASVTGILAVAAKATTTLTTFFSNMKRIPASAHSLLREITDLSACLSQVQAFLLGDQEADQNRMQLLMVEQLVVALSHCVLSMSELEKFLDSMKITDSFSARARFRWTREEQNITGILIRLQASKNSLNLMLTTLTCSSVKEAQRAVSDLIVLVHKVLESNEQLASRMADMQLQVEGSNVHTTSAFRVPMESIDEMSIMTSTTLLARNPSSTGRPLSNYNGFDQNLWRELNESQVYVRNRRRFSLDSISSSTAQSLSYSFLSRCSLAVISNISVIRLPIYPRDLWDPSQYLLPKIERHDVVKDHPIADTASTRTGMDSLIDQLLVRDAPNYKIALLGTNIAGNSTVLMLLYLSWSSIFAYDNNLRIILQQIQATFLNLEELVKDHKLQVDGEIQELLETVKSFRIGSSLTSDRALIELCQRLCQDPDIRVAIEWECTTELGRPTYPTHLKRIESRSSGLINDQVKFLDLLEFLLPYHNNPNKDILDMLSCVSGRYRTTFKLNDGPNQHSVEITSMTGLQTQLTTSTMTGVDHLFYVVPLCSYCATLGGRNQMEVFLELFALMLRLKPFRDTQISVIFTQADIFPQRVLDVPVCGTSAQAAYQYFVHQFRERHHRNNAKLHIFAPGLDGTTSLQATLDKLHNLVLENLHSKQQVLSNRKSRI